MSTLNLQIMIDNFTFYTYNYIYVTDTEKISSEKKFAALPSALPTTHPFEGCFKCK